MTVWYVGAILAVLASVGTNLGINIQKYSFLQNSQKPKDQQRPYIKQPGWALGLSLVIFGSVGDFAALALAAQSIVAPIGSVTLVANIIFAHFWLKESLSRRDFIGTILIIAGSVLTVAFGDHSSQTYSLAQFLDYFSHMSCYAYAISLTAVSVPLYVLIRIAQPIKRELVAYEQCFEAIKSETERRAVREADVEFKACEQRYRKFKRMLPFSYCSLSGILGAQSVLFGKLVGGLLSTTFQGDNQLLSPYPYIFLFCMLAFIFAQIHFLALALQLFDALYCVPMFQCFFIVISTIGGAAFFEEFGHFTTLQFIMFPLGIFVTLSGVGLLAQRDSSTVSPGAHGRHIIPASTATFFLDLAVEKTNGANKFQRSRSHNFLPGADTGKSKVQLEKAAIETEANAAASLALAGGMKLPDHVEQSVRDISMNHESSYANSSRVSPHGRTNRNTFSSVQAPSRQPTRLAKQPSHHQRAESTQPEHHHQPPTPSRDSVSITINDEKRARRKAKSRSHPNHWPQGSTVESIAASLAPCPPVVRAGTSTALAFEPARPSANKSSTNSSIAFYNNQELLDIPMTTLDRSRSEDAEGTDRGRCPSARMNKHNAVKLGLMQPMKSGDGLSCHHEECDEEPSILDGQLTNQQIDPEPASLMDGSSSNQQIEQSMNQSISQSTNLTAYPSTSKRSLPPLADRPSDAQTIV